MLYPDCYHCFVYPSLSWTDNISTIIDSVYIFLMQRVLLHRRLLALGKSKPICPSIRSHMTRGWGPHSLLAGWLYLGGICVASLLLTLFLVMKLQLLCNYLSPVRLLWPLKVLLLLLLLLSRFSHFWPCATPWTAAHQAPPSLGFSRQGHWSGLPFPSPMHESEKWKWSHSVVYNCLQPHGLQPTRLLHPWDFPGKSTGVGCHCLCKTLESNLCYICDILDHLYSDSDVPLSQKLISRGLIVKVMIGIGRISSKTGLKRFWTLLSYPLLAHTL